MVLDQWALVPLNPSPYNPPELGPKGLHGVVYDGPKFADGDEITTTELIDLRKEGKWVLAETRSGSVYQLGAVNPAYEKQFPNALERLLAVRRK